MLKRLSYDDLLTADERVPLEEAERRLFGSYPKLLAEVLDNRLTYRQKCYIMLYYKDGLTMEQIAARYGVTRSTVSRTVKRARDRLKEAIGCEIVRKRCTKKD